MGESKGKHSGRATISASTLTRVATHIPAVVEKIRSCERNLPVITGAQTEPGIPVLSGEPVTERLRQSQTRRAICPPISTAARFQQYGYEWGRTLRR
jgi:hypothetical protein